MKMKLFHVIATSLLGTAMALGTGFALANKQESRQVRAVEETITPSDFEAVTGAAIDETISGFRFECNTGTTTSEQFRVFKDSTLTISAANLTKIEFTCTAEGTAKYGPGCFSAFSGYSYSGAVGTWTGDAESVSFTASSNQVRITEFVITGTGSSGTLGTLVIKNGSGEVGPFANLDVNNSSGFTFYSYDDSDVQKVASFALSNSTVANLVDNGDGSCKVTPKAAGTVNLSASLENYKTANCSLTFVYTYEHAGTEADPFTVVEALLKATEIGAVGNKGQGPWVTTGIISHVVEKPVADYWNATYYISDDGTRNNELQVYRGYYLEANGKFDAETAELVKVGNTVVVTGNITGSYGNEYCQGNYALSIEKPSTGDIDVTFEPTLSYEIGATGTFTASTTATNPTYTWEVEDSSILSVNASTGKFEALSLGSTKVTVNVSATEGNGSAFAVITVNGNSYMTILDVLKTSLEDGQTTDYYIYTEGYVKEFATSQKDGKPRAFNIADENGVEVMVFTGLADYDAWVDGLSLGDFIRVKANIQNYGGVYELVTPTKISSEYVAMSLAYEILSRTDLICEDYDDVTDNGTAIAGIWETLAGEGFYGALSSEQKEALANADADELSTNVLEQAMARYDYLTKKYKLSNWIVGRTINANRNSLTPITNVNNTVMMVVIISSVVVAVSLAGVFFIIRRRKHQ